MIREATIEDIPDIVAMGRQFISTSHYADLIPVRPDILAQTVYRMIQSDESAIFVADHAEAGLVGMAGICSYRHPLTQDLFATELFLWVNPDHRGRAGLELIREAEAWAEWRGAAALQLIAPTPNVEQLYGRLGYTKVETSYMRRLDRAQRRSIA